MQQSFFFDFSPPTFYDERVGTKREKKTIRFKIKDLGLKYAGNLKSSILNPRSLLFIGLLGYLFIGLFSPKASAATMTNDSYSVDKQSVQIQPFVTEAPQPQRQAEQPYALGENYTVLTTSPQAFSFGVSQNSISFGTLQATNPVVREITLALTSSQGYQILAGASHPLQKETNVFIPDTTCDNGSCSEFTPAPWVNTLTYGFGFRTSSMETDAYKQFSNLSQNEIMQPILKGLQAKNLLEKITYRINISAMQSPGSYSNTIFYIATPDF